MRVCRGGVGGGYKYQLVERRKGIEDRTECFTFVADDGLWDRAPVYSQSLNLLLALATAAL